MAQKTVLPVRNINDKDLRRIRVQKVLQRTTSGYTNDEVSKELGISRATVARDMTYAKEHGLLDKIENRIAADLAPLAIEVYRKKLVEDEDAFVAKDVLGLIGKFLDRRAKTEQVTQTFTIQDYVRSRQNSSINEEPITVEALPGETINETDPGEQAE